jgi:hypothetical protein
MIVVITSCGLEQARDAAPDRARQRAGGQRERQMHDHRQTRRQRIADKHADQRAHIKLALRADVEQPGHKAQRNTQPEQYVGRRDEQRIAERTAARKRALHKRRIDLERVRAGDDQDHACDDQRDQHRQQRHRDAAE